jgi:hypothetical protein
MSQMKVSKRRFAFLTLQLILLCQSSCGFSLYPQQSQLRTSSSPLYAKRQPSVDERESLTTNNNNINPSPLLRNSVLVSTVAIPCLLLLASAAHAIDLPSVDNFHLDIPNPLPDADPRYFLSGGICAAASHGITTPVDVIKTRQQAAPEKYNGGLVSVATDIVKEDGPTALLVGLLPTIVGYGTEGKAQGR